MTDIIKKAKHYATPASASAPAGEAGGANTTAPTSFQYTPDFHARYNRHFTRDEVARRSLDVPAAEEMRARRRDEYKTVTEE